MSCSVVIVETIAAYRSAWSSMCPPFGALQLNDDQGPGTVQGEQIDPPPGISEHRVLLGDHQQVITQNIDPLPQRALQVPALADLLPGQTGPIDRLQATGTVTVQGHGAHSGPQALRRRHPQGRDPSSTSASRPRPYSSGD